MRRWRALVVVGVLGLVGGCAGADDSPSTVLVASSRPPSATTSTVLVEPAQPASPGPAALLYRLDGELHVDGVSLGIRSAGPGRWRPGHPTEVTYGSHSNERLAGVFLVEQIFVRDIDSGADRLLIDIADHGWSRAGHFDWDRSGSLLVLAAEEEDGVFRPQILDATTGGVSRVPTDTEIIDTVFAPDGRILGIDTSGAAGESETLAWVDNDGTVTPIEPSAGVNRDPVVSQDLRYVANIRAASALSRVGLGRWDLIITDLSTGEEWAIGDGSDGFGPPRWIDSQVLVAKHARYSSAGVVNSIPDVVLVNVATGEVSLVPDRSRAWDPDPRV